MVHLERLLVSPIAALDPVSVSSAELVDGGIAWDHRYTITKRTAAVGSTTEATGDQYVETTSEPRLHELETTYDLERATVTVRKPSNDDTQTFHLELDQDCVASWLSEFLNYPVEIVCNQVGDGSNDGGRFESLTDGAATGPTVVSTGTLEAVASWYEGIDPAEMCRRLRPNLVVDAAPFWEDRLYGAPGSIVPIDIGPATLQGVRPRQHDAVATRDPETGETTPGFRETFLERRKASLPEWANEAQFDYYFRITAETRVPERSRGQRLSVGETVSVGRTVTDSTPASGL